MSVIASPTRRFGDLDIVGEAAAEAFATAVERWPTDGVPPNPGGWLTTTANRKAIDRLRRENKRDDNTKGLRCCTRTTRPSLSAPSTTSDSA
ncbi:MAG TPA: sigma factor [Solirubrobacteraceae bacterium]|nr:sigma factor [Solirubrobacteraceae bacterium]